MLTLTAAKSLAVWETATTPRPENIESAVLGSEKPIDPFPPVETAFSKDY